MIGHVAIFRTYANSLILRLARTIQGPCRFAVWFLSYLGWIYSETLWWIGFANFHIFGWTPYMWVNRPVYDRK